MKECSIEKCDIFDFMSNYVGLTVLHPGGFNATHKLANSCQIDNNSRVVDIACGKGTSAVYLAQKYGCQVIGIDISEDSVAHAADLARRKGLESKVSFRVGNALNMPFMDNEFDVAVSQAILVLVNDKKRPFKKPFVSPKQEGVLNGSN